MTNDAIKFIPESLLQKALNTQLECAKLGFDWPDVAPVFDKVLEEIEEVKAEVYSQQRQQDKIEDEIGDLFFAIVNLSRHLEVNPDVALKKANEKFSKRFSLVQKFAANEDLELTSLHIDALELLWDKAKKTLNQAQYPAT
jgi:ATP diphosphatase